MRDGAGAGRKYQQGVFGLFPDLLAVPAQRWRVGKHFAIVPSERRFIAVITNTQCLAYTRLFFHPLVIIIPPHTHSSYVCNLFQQQASLIIDWLGGGWQK